MKSPVETGRFFIIFNLNKMFIKKIIFFFFISSMNCFPQGGFKKNYFLPNSLAGVSKDAVETPNGNLLIIGFTVSSFSNTTFNYLTIAVTDAQGNFLWNKNHGNSKFQYLDNSLTSRCVISDNTGIYYTSSILDSVGGNYSVLAKFDFTGDMIWQKIFKEPSCNLISQAVSKSADGGFLVTGFLQDNSGSVYQEPILLLKTDINGNELWRKKLITSNTSNPGWSGNRCIQDTLTKKIIIVGYQYLGGGIYPLTLVTDSVGNVLLNVYNVASQGVFSDIIQTKDKKFVAVGAKSIIPTTNSLSMSRGNVAKFDINGQNLWEKEFDILATSNFNEAVVELPNGDLVVAGIRDTANLYTWTEIRVVKMDFNGNVKWQNYYSHSTSYNANLRARSLNLTSNGSYLVAADYYMSSDLRPYRLLRIDSTGCDTTESFCKAINVGINSFTELKGWQLSVFPNPVKDLLHINLNAPVDKQVLVKITDVAGREIGQLPLTTNSELSLNTGNYAGGVYLLQFLDEERVMATQRVVVLK